MSDFFISASSIQAVMPRYAALRGKLVFKTVIYKKRHSELNTDFIDRH